MRWRRCKSGFTFIELLVVVAVLAILIAILFPVFLRVRQLGYRAQCAGNLRQFGAAFSLYAQDWAGYWPGPGGLYGDRCYWSQTGQGGLESYTRQRGIGSVWCCPLLTEWHGSFPARSYSMNSYLRTPVDVEYPSCVTYPTCLSCQRGVNTYRIMDPMNTVLLFEGMPLTGGSEDKLDYLYRCANYTRVRGYAPGITRTIASGRPWHGVFNNYLYCDGHIVARPPGKRFSPSHDLPVYREMRQWYVDKRVADHNYRTVWSRWIPFE